MGVAAILLPLTIMMSRSLGWRGNVLTKDATVVVD